MFKKFALFCAAVLASVTFLPAAQVLVKPIQRPGWSFYSEMDKSWDGWPSYSVVPADDTHPTVSARRPRSRAPGFRTASSGAYVFTVGFANPLILSDDGFLSKLDPSGSVIWTKTFAEIMGSHGWSPMDVKVISDRVYVCGLLDQSSANRGFVAKLTLDGTLEDYSLFTASGTGNFARATSLAVSSYGGAPSIVVVGDALGDTLRVQQRQRLAAADVYTALMLHKHGTAVRSDVFIVRMDANLAANWATTMGFERGDDYANAVTADNDGNIYLALNSAPNADYDGGSSRIHQVDGHDYVSSSRPVYSYGSSAMLAGVQEDVGLYLHYDFWPGYWGMLLKIDSQSGVNARIRRMFLPCKVESGEADSGNHISDLAYYDGSVYVAGEWRGRLRPQMESMEAAFYLDSAGSPVKGYDAFVTRLDASTLNANAWRLFSSGGEEFIHEMTVDASGVFLAGTAGGSLDTFKTYGGENQVIIPTDAQTERTTLGGSVATHLFWQKLNLTTLAVASNGHLTPVEDTGANISIPTGQRNAGIATVGDTAVFVGGRDSGDITFGPVGERKTLPSAGWSAFAGYLKASDMTFLREVTVTINSAYGNPSPHRGVDTVAAGRTITATVPPEIYETASGGLIDPQDTEAIRTSAVTRRVCTGYQFRNSTVNGTANTVTFIASADTELTFLWRTEHAVEVVSDLTGTDGLTSTAAGNPDPPVQKHWIRENEQFTAFIDGAEADIAVPGVRWRCTGFVADGCVANAQGVTSGSVVRWGYQPRQQTAKITVGSPGRIVWLWQKEFSVRVAVNSSVASGAPVTYSDRPEPTVVFWPVDGRNYYRYDFWGYAPAIRGVLLKTGAAGAPAGKIRVQYWNNSTWVTVAAPDVAAMGPGQAQRVLFETVNDYAPYWSVTALDTGGSEAPISRYSMIEVDRVGFMPGVVAGQSTGTGEFWYVPGSTVTVSAPGTVNSGISVLALKGYTGGLGSVAPYDTRNVTSKTFTINAPSSITWDYARAIYPETVYVGQPITFSGVTGVDATNASRTKAPLAGNVQTAPSGSSFADMVAWDAVSQRALVLRPGKFTAEFENKAAATDAAQNVIVEVTAVWGTPDYTHILETPPVDLDPSTADSLKFLSLSYSEGGAQVSSTNFAAPEPGRSVLLFSSRIGGVATGNLEQEPLKVKVVNTLPWAASAQAFGNWAAPATIGQEITSADHSASVGHNGFVLSAFAPVNAAAHERETATGPIFPVNENFPDTGRWSSGNDPAQTRLLAGRIIEFDSADDLLLDPATVKVAVALNGDTSRTVKGVLFQADQTPFPGLKGRSFDTLSGDTYLTTIANLFSAAPTATFDQSAGIAYDNNFIPAIPGLTSPETFTVLWEGWLDVARDGTGEYTFGTASDDGSVLYLDLNADGDFADAGEMIVDNRGLHGAQQRTGTVNLGMASVRMAVAFFEEGGGEFMEARFKRGGNLSYPSLDVISGSSGYFTQSNPYVTGNGIAVSTTAAAAISNWAAPAFTGTSAAELSEIMRDFRYSNAPNSVDVTVRGLTPGQVYNIQLLTNETSSWERRFDVAVNNTLAVDNYTSSGHSAGRRWRPDNSYAWSVEYVAPADGILRIQLAKDLGGNPALPFDSNPILNAVIVHAVNAVQGAGSPVIDEPGSLAVAWYHQRDGINWPWKAVRYNPQWPASPGRIVTASRLGSEGKKTSADTIGQQQFGTAAWSDPVIYHQPEPDAPGYNPNEEHSLIAPSFLDTSRSAAFALRADLNRTALNGDFTSKPYTLVQYTDKSDASNPVVKMAVYSIADEDSSITDSRLPSFNQKYTYFYQGEAGQRLLPPYPLDVVIGPSTWPEETSAENVDGRVAYHEDKKNNAWILSGDTDTAEDIRAELYYPIRADFWHPTLEAGDVMPLGHLPAASPVRDILYNTIWPANVAQLKAGETLTFTGGEYATDRGSDTPQPKGLPGAVAWQSGKLLFDSANATMSPIQTGSNYMARLIPALSKREVPLAFTALPDELKPASGNVIVEGLIWRFKKLPASLQKRCYYDSSSQKLGFRGYLNDRTLGDGDLLAAPGAQTILQPNVITDADSALIAGLSTAAGWQSAVTALVNLTRNPLDALATGALPLGLEPASGGSLPATLFGPGLAVITNPEIHKSTTAASLPDGYITIAENDDESLGDAPVAIHVIKVIREKYRGSIAVLRPENVFDEKLTLRHTADFGGDVSDLFFEWYYKEEDGRDLNPPGVTLPTAGTPTGADWTVFGSGAGLNEIQISGASPATLTDNVFYVRYRHKDDTANWSAWGGAANSREPKPSSPSAAVDIAYVAQLAPGWIKRVTDAVNLFDARIKDFRNNNAPATYTSMIQQAGQRWEGPVAFNPQKDAIENVGMIELYQTVLDRGKDLSINLSPGTDGVNTALLNAANRIAGLYTLLGNEAMADAADPTVGYSTVNGQFGRLAPVLHSFQNQTGNLLQEEIALLRGRGEVGARPAYNRLMWNFTNGSGEAAYVLNYGITDLTNDGFLTDADARRLYPQGHGDAWGHYTMALKGYYDLATLNNFTWSSRSEKYLIDGIVLDVDYLDERAFAKTAAARAQCGAQLVDLVYRQAYTENPNGQWQGYRDTNTDRAWGVYETAQRTGTAALCDWLTANALLKAEETDPAKTGIRKVDRTTVGELKLIAAQAAAIQAKLDSADRGMNPAGLDPDVVPFDIDPALTDRTNPNAATHFEQVYNRATTANRNAVAAFNNASEAGLQVRRTAASTEELRKQAQDQDLAYRNKLIEYFGTPYEGMIGGGKAYPEGYSGPDLYLWMYVDQVSAGQDVVPDLDGDIVAVTIPAGLRNLARDTNPFSPGAVSVHSLLQDTVSRYFPADVPVPNSTPAPLALNLPRQAKDYAFAAPADWGQRRGPGRIQAALQDLVHAEWKVRMAIDAYEGTADDFKLLLRKFEAKSGIAAEKLRVAAYTEDRQDLWNNVATVAFGAAAVADQIRDLMDDTFDVLQETLPKIAGLAIDPAAPARGAIGGTGITVEHLLRVIATGAQITQYRAELEAEEALVEMEQALLTEDLKSEIVDLLAEIEQLALDEGDLRLAVIDALESMRAASDRVRTVTQEGLAIIDERTVFNQRVAATTTQQRYEDFTFRVTHTEALRKYQSAFDLAGRYAYLAGKAYAYELNLPDNHAANATPLLAEMLRTRTLGEWDGTFPVVGQGGIAEQLAILKTNFDTLKGQLGFNNPATEVNSFSVRAELGRIGLSSRVNADWRTKLETWRVPDLWNFQYENNGVNYGYVFRRYCRPFAPEAAGAQPALVIPFDSSIAAGKNWFGKTLAGGDSSFNASNFSTKIRSAGIRFDGYNNTAMSQTPQVYLVPVGMDRMFLPDSLTLADRSWNVVDQRIPVPLPISPGNLADPNWQPYTGSASGFFEEIRKFSSFRAYHDAGGYSPAEMLSTGRLVGRSVWNTQWVLIIPSATLLYDAGNPSAGIDTLIYGAPLPGYTQTTAGNTYRDLIGARDIRILLQTYSISGN